MSDHHHHHHGHHHGHHHHGTGPSATGENQDYFNKLAAEYDARHEKTLNKLIEEIRARVDFIGVDWADEEDDDDNNGGDGAEKKDAAAKRSVRLLDYACGTGVVSRALAPYTTQCVGVDLSENMVAIYNTRAENQGLAPSEMHAYQGNLCVPDDPNPAALTAPEFSDFDIAAVGLGFHHFDNPSLAARRLAERLKTGGVLMILDFLPHDNMDDSHPAKATVTHHGFSHEHIKRLYEEAGVGKDFGIEEMAVVFHFSKEQDTAVQRKIFIARGTKA